MSPYDETARANVRAALVMFMTCISVTAFVALFWWLGMRPEPRGGAMVQSELHTTERATR